MFCRTCQTSGHRRAECPMYLSGEGTTEGCFEISRGGPMVPLGDETLYFEVQFFKYNAAPQYYVKYAPNEPMWNCTCPYRLYHPGVMCKHCTTCVHLKQGVDLPGGNYASFLDFHVREMDAISFERILATPVGQPLPQEDENKCLKVQYDSDQPGDVEYRERWCCWTCGGANGFKHLKGRMCKHIACYEKSFTDNSYVQCVTEMEDHAAFRQECDSQRHVWQRFSLLTF